MRKLPKPIDDNGSLFVAEEVFDLCISHVRNPSLKARLKTIRSTIAKAAVKYEAAASKAELFRLTRHAAIGSVSKGEMIKVYSGRMAKLGQPGRSVYDKILNSPKFQRCPLCDLGVVATLDHHMPKSEYPDLAVVPNNLVPACHWCQGAKKETYPTNAKEQTLHPYFDDFESDVWLLAEVVQSVPAAFRYCVQPPAGLNQGAARRLKRHLTVFRLTELFAHNAGSELSEIRARLRKLLQLGGPEAVRVHLLEEVQSRQQESKNSWKVAMYRAAAASDWFCSGGFAAV